MTVQIYPDGSQLARAAADHFITLATEALANRGRFAVALSGGSTPLASYRLLATDEFAARVDWTTVHLFWGDERCVPPDHPDSNYRMAREALLDRVPLPAGNVHRIYGEHESDRAAVEYERELRAFFLLPPVGAATEGEARVDCFDLILLGMGSDGHTASLFPGTMPIHELERWVMAHHVDKLGAWRITLTPPAINSAAQVTFLVSGAAKAQALRQALTGPYRPHELPAQAIRPGPGRLRWLVDREAAALLDPGT